MSEVKVNKISPRTNCGTTQLGDAGDTITVTGDLKSNSLKSASGSTITLGQSGDTIQLGCGASQTGFGRTGTVDWDTTAKTASFTAVSGNGYFVNTTSGAITATLPASPSAGDIVGFNDYARTFETNNLTIARNGSNIQGAATDATILTNGQSTMFVYVDATQGWIPTEDQTTGNYGVQYVSATGGTIVTNGNFKTHIFTSPGTFCVSCAGNAGGSNTVDYFVVAGGGGGGNDTFAPANRGGGGAGGGGFRLSNSVGCLPAPSMSPLVNPTGLPVSVTGYPITVGGGGAGGIPGGPYSGARGSNSIFSSITSTGGGGGAGHAPAAGGSDAPTPGGSGGGRQDPAGPAGGQGNVPPVSPPQGNPAGNAGGGPPNYTAGGGGGAGSVGGNAPGPGPTIGGNGGDGSFIACSMIGPTAPSYGTPGPATGRYFAGGGGAKESGTGGAGGGAAASGGAAATVNTGGGGGGQRSAPAGNGGSGIVMIRYKYQ